MKPGQGIQHPALDFAFFLIFSPTCRDPCIRIPVLPPLSEAFRVKDVQKGAIPAWNKLTGEHRMAMTSAPFQGGWTVPGRQANVAEKAILA